MGEQGLSGQPFRIIAGLGLALGLTLIAAPPVHAQPAGAQAEALFLRGQELLAADFSG
ncbi:MAG TPA: hypothetical protein VH165_30410 [Kofleriaceae bacterium]|jgi:hypothetical protein|nr:hypothetical protein [Kofleriaceae bacterium]